MPGACSQALAYMITFKARRNQLAVLPRFSFNSNITENTAKGCNMHPYEQCGSGFVSKSSNASSAFAHLSNFRKSSPFAAKENAKLYRALRAKKTLRRRKTCLLANFANPRVLYATKRHAGCWGDLCFHALKSEWVNSLAWKKFFFLVF